MTEDLSQYHQPIGDLCPRAEHDGSQFRLSNEQVEFYREHGYLAGIRLLNEAQIEVLRREVRRGERRLGHQESERGGAHEHQAGRRLLAQEVPQQRRGAPRGGVVRRAQASPRSWASRASSTRPLTRSFS